MSHLSHDAVRRRMQELFVGRLAPAKVPDLMAHARECRACGRAYRRYAELETALCDSRAEPTVFAVERIAAGVLEHPSVRQTTPRHLRRLILWFAPLPAVALLTIVLLPARPPQDHVTLAADSELAAVAVRDVVTARGSDSAAAAQIGVRLFRAETPSGEREAQVRGEAGEAGQLALHATVTFTYTNLLPEVQRLTLFGIQSDGAIRWYYPSYDREHSISILTDRIDEPLGDGVQLSTNHEAGALQVVALFSQRPIRRELIEDMVETTYAGTLPLVGISAAMREDSALYEHSFVLTLGAAGSRESEE